MMKPVLGLVLATFFAAAAFAQDDGAGMAAAAEDPPAFAPVPADGLDLNDFLWQKRVIVIFADTPADPAFDEQMRLFARDPAALADRDVVVVTDTDPAAATAVRTRLRPRGFALVLVDKDGMVKFRKPFPWDVRELTRAIDKTPLRLEELRMRRAP